VAVKSKRPVTVDIVYVNKGGPDYDVLDKENVIVRRTYGTDDIRFLRYVTCEKRLREKGDLAIQKQRSEIENQVESNRHLEWPVTYGITLRWILKQSW
jgi:hypothetical protein